MHYLQKRLDISRKLIRAYGWTKVFSSCISYMSDKVSVYSLCCYLFSLSSWTFSNCYLLINPDTFPSLIKKKRNLTRLVMKEPLRKSDFWWILHLEQINRNHTLSSDKPICVGDNLQVCHQQAHATTLGTIQRKILNLKALSYFKNQDSFPILGKVHLEYLLSLLKCGYRKEIKIFLVGHFDPMERYLSENVSSKEAWFFYISSVKVHDNEEILGDLKISSVKVNNLYTSLPFSDAI